MLAIGLVLAVQDGALDPARDEPEHRQNGLPVAGGFALATTCVAGILFSRRLARPIPGRRLAPERRGGGLRVAYQLELQEAADALRREVLAHLRALAGRGTGPTPIPAAAADPIAELREAPVGVVRSWLRIAPVLVARIQDAAAEQDVEGLRHDARALASSSASVGAGRLAALAAAMERHARIGSAAEAIALAPCIETELGLARAALEALRRGAA